MASSQGHREWKGTEEGRLRKMNEVRTTEQYFKGFFYGKYFSKNTH
jgi:hypothetical protein